MRSRYLDTIAGEQRRRNRKGEVVVSARLGLVFLAFVALGLAFVRNLGTQMQLTDNTLIAVCFALILTIGGPSLAAFLVPWSPAGMLLQKIQARTWGFAAVIFCCGFILYYAIELSYSFWATQPVVVSERLLMQQIAIDVIGFFFIPALLFTPVSEEELIETIRQAHLVKRYALQTQADIAILRVTLLSAQVKALIGFANLTVAEKEELAGVMRGLVRAIDQEARAIGGDFRAISYIERRFRSLDDSDDRAGFVDYHAELLEEGVSQYYGKPATHQEEDDHEHHNPEPARISRRRY